MFGLGNNARCNIQANSNNNTSSLASASQPSATPEAIPAASTWQAAGQVADIGAMSTGGSSDNLFGFHSLLDLMFMVVFESPDAMQV
jgi:hypothetical protein